MSCKRPLKGFIIPDKYADRGYTVKVQGYDVQAVAKRAGRWFPVDSVDAPGDQIVTEYIDIPCGKCVGCRLQYSKQWADRCLMELQDHKSAYFLTLTYDDEHLPFPEHEEVYTYVDDETGECGVLPTLVKRDMQLFHKRLRERTGQKIRYFTAGEYGDHTQRPHYHSIEFGLEISDLQVYTIRNGYTLWISEFIDSIWQNGHVIIGEVTWETCAYTARYVMKKLNGKCGDYYTAHNIEPEFVLMSRKPGIGKSFFERRGKELYHFRSTPVSDSSGAKLVSSTNRYFDRLMANEDDAFMVDVKKKRIEAAKHTEVLKGAQTSNFKLDRLLAEEEVLINKSSSLKRIDI